MYRGNLFRTNFFGQVWGNAGKSPSHPQKICLLLHLCACSSLHDIRTVSLALRECECHIG